MDTTGANIPYKEKTMELEAFPDAHWHPHCPLLLATGRMQEESARVAVPGSGDAAEQAGEEHSGFSGNRCQSTPKA